MVNSFPFPVSPLRLASAEPFWNAYYTKALVDVSGGVVPTLSITTSFSKVTGTVPMANAEYPTTIIEFFFRPLPLRTGVASQKSGIQGLSLKTHIGN